MPLPKEPPSGKRKEALLKLFKMPAKDRERLLKLERLKRDLPEGSALPPVRSAARSQNSKPDTSPPIERLSPSEIESLRSEMQSSSDWMRRELERDGS
jgi:hypothetical protein